MQTYATLCYYDNVPRKRLQNQVAALLIQYIDQVKYTWAIKYMGARPPDSGYSNNPFVINCSTVFSLELKKKEKDRNN